MSALRDRLDARTARVVVMGIGYVGLPLAAELARAGFRVTGLDRDAEKARLLNAGESSIDDVTSGQLAPHVTAGRLDATTDAAVLGEADAVVVCVPTPLTKSRDPDMRFIVGAIDEIAAHQHEGMLIVLESTTYPGTTREVVAPRLGARFRLGEQVFIAFSPERVDPGNAEFSTRNTPKLVGGMTPACLDMATALYSGAIDRLVPVSSTEVAEMAKLLENTFRAVNIGLVNEVALMSRRLGIDPHEVIRAASTKPFGYTRFRPGPGLGGHCIPNDPLYLSWKLRTLKYEARFIEVADAVNRSMPAYVVARVAEVLAERGTALSGARVLVYGVAYKPGVSDVRESPAFEILGGLRARGADVAYMDPRVPALPGGERSIDPAASFADYDAVVIVTDHPELDRERLRREARLVVDTRDCVERGENVVGL